MTMTAKKNTTTSLPKLKIGSRVRCTEDGVEGRIVWANAVSLKIAWDDGEQVTWKRDSLATRPIVILEADQAAEADVKPEQPQEVAAPEQAALPEQVATS